MDYLRDVLVQREITVQWGKCPCILEKKQGGLYGCRMIKRVNRRDKIEGVTRGKIVQDLDVWVTVCPGLSNATFIHTSRLGIIKTWDPFIFKNIPVWM